jgi:glutathione synthase/RimK-type ligase-like ATP-grasp enzyme
MTPHDGTARQAGAEPLLGFAALMRMTFAGGDVDALATRLIDRVNRDPVDANAMLDLSTLLQLRFRPALGLAMQAQALDVQRLYHLGAAPDEAEIRLLALMAPGDLMANTPLDCLLEGSGVALDILYVCPEEPLPAELPPHDLVFVGVGEPDRNRAVLRKVAALLDLTSRPVLNPPDRALLLGRDSASELLRWSPGISMPVTARAPRDLLHRIAEESVDAAMAIAGVDFPLLVRPIGSHAGKALAKIDTPAVLEAYLADNADGMFYVSRFIDYRNADGRYRKYRVVLIDGAPYACHMGVSDHWMIHYLNAGMTECAVKRGEEAEFMARFDDVFAVRHRAAFAAIFDKMGLDYIGIDCAETAAGDLLIFEVDTGMIVHALDPVDVFPYKQPQMQKVFRAFTDMLVAASKRPDKRAAVEG